MTHFQVCVIKGIKFFAVAIGVKPRPNYRELIQNSTVNWSIPVWENGRLESLLLLRFRDSFFLINAQKLGGLGAEANQFRVAWVVIVHPLYPLVVPGAGSIPV